MLSFDPRVDEYIKQSPDFAKPILTHLRALVHEACPGVQEAMKWSSPSFQYKGMLCGMQAFKGYCRFGFWKSTLVLGPKVDRDPASQFGEIARVSDLPSKKALMTLVRKAAALNEAGVKLPAAPKKPKKALVVPPALKSALAKNRKAAAAFDAFSPSHQREYAEWIDQAKQEATRDRRVKTAIEWMTQGKGRNWKYQ